MKFIMYSETTLLKWLPHLPGGNELSENNHYGKTIFVIYKYPIVNDHPQASDHQHLYQKVLCPKLMGIQYFKDLVFLLNL